MTKGNFVFLRNCFWIRAELLKEECEAVHSENRKEKALLGLNIKTLSLGQVQHNALSRALPSLFQYKHPQEKA